MIKFTFKPLVYILFLSIFACKKDTTTHPINDDDSSDETPSEYLKNLLPVEGSCIDTSGNLLFFQFPFLSSPHNPVISAKILKLNTLNSNPTIFDFQGQTF